MCWWCARCFCGRRKGGTLFYDDFTELLLCDRKGIQVSFLGIQTEDNKFRVKLQIRNGGSQKQTVWIKNLALDGKIVLPAQMLGQFASSRSGTAEVTVSRSLQNPVFRLEFSLEVRRSKKDLTALGKAGVSVDAKGLPPVVKAL